MIDNSISLLGYGTVVGDGEDKPHGSCQPDSKTRVKHTRSIVLIGEIGSILRTRHESAPEGTAYFTAVQTRCINLTSQASILEEVLKVCVIDLVMIEGSDQNQEIVVTV